MMIDEIANALRGKTVFLTGHTGFKGTWLSMWLHSLGSRVVGYSLAPPTSPNNFTVSQVNKFLDRHIHGDIRDADRIRNAVLESQPDFLFHMAAQTVVRTGYQLPRETFDVNVTGTASVLDAVAALEQPCTVVCVTSDKCYANTDQPRAFEESDPMGEREPYGASKGCTELVVKAYSHSFFHPAQFDQHQKAVATARAGNVIGGGDWTPAALVPDLVEAARNGSSVSLRNPLATRPWQHVLQTLSGYLLLATRLAESPSKYTGGWNFGPNENCVMNVADFSSAFFRIWGQGGWVDASDSRSFHEAQTLTLSIAKARRELEWNPVWDTEQTISHCVSWFQKYLAGYNPTDLCLEQIRAFEQDWQTTKTPC